ncbi:uncharacterized protein MYCFIDRAFT_181797 [Pseudocercospora fijiensis CIRAD86]|uniref:Uncharacterized protein n=1 Tax=Pseudocercospora fijiensis (strain CIRAD86) TaxID=383855 RepID=M3A412_PSEFD|nr:uncharacterized protein MYCFIDRAFT_181797 [Pseudocercospora fijiensis CIRAD86]EME85844.1 hypothetical protein MYCFIDRAFT_181797 [Pseudocercospora fijiensis CIRAD86]
MPQDPRHSWTVSSRFRNRIIVIAHLRALVRCHWGLEASSCTGSVLRSMRSLPSIRQMPVLVLRRRFQEWWLRALVEDQSSVTTTKRTRDEPTVAK